MLASINQDTELFNFLVSKGVYFNLIDSYRKTALMYSCQSISEEILIERGANINLKNENRNTALIYAIKKDDNEIINRISKRDE